MLRSEKLTNSSLGRFGKGVLNLFGWTDSFTMRIEREISFGVFVRMISWKPQNIYVGQEGALVTDVSSFCAHLLQLSQGSALSAIGAVPSGFH
jgi:hypothetical protein